jgi:redox-sensitive bicupin YhaK (pirin superfamily)
MRIEKNAFQSKEDVYRDMIETGFWPTTYLSGPSPELPLHWHDGDTIGYVMAGSTYVLDSDGNRCQLEPGDKLIIPAGALHAEGQVAEPVTYIVTTRDPVPFLQAFRMLDPDAYPDPKMLDLDPELMAELAASMAP